MVPVYNEAVHIEGCLRSLLNQSIASDQHMIMVLDGGSTDGTTDVVQRLIDEQQGSLVPLLELDAQSRRTVAHARNRALEQLPSSVEYLIEMIGHAEVEPHHLERRLQACKHARAKQENGWRVWVCKSLNLKTTSTVGAMD